MFKKELITISGDDLNLYDSIFNRGNLAKMIPIKQLRQFQKRNCLTVDTITRAFKFRQIFLNEYSIWGLPTAEASRALSKTFLHSNIYDFGSGTGYLSYCLKLVNPALNIYAIDNYSTGHCMIDKNKSNLWFDILNVNAIDYARNVHNSTCIINWAVYNSNFAYDLCDILLRNNNQVIYIGESQGGCNANDKFFDSFKLTKIKSLGWFSWSGVNDQVYAVTLM